jgi:hypothetical protein
MWLGTAETDGSFDAMHTIEGAAGTDETGDEISARNRFWSILLRSCSIRTDER